jgi:hypothetical protein
VHGFLESLQKRAVERGENGQAACGHSGAQPAA